MNKFNKIYVYCPADAVTGGPDALHQLVFYLRNLGCDAEIVYYDCFLGKIPSIPQQYKEYVSSYLLEKDVVDEANNAVVLPENAVSKQVDFKKARVFIWWLSVDNNLYRSSFFWKICFFVTLPARIVKNFSYYKNHFREAVLKTLQKRMYSFENERENVEHICASYYAYNFVSARTKRNVSVCIEPISKYFLDRYEVEKRILDSGVRKDEVLYNPKKSAAFVKEISRFAPEIKFIPLVGMNQDQLVEKYKSSKLFVDFGHFPGAERMPKEAALFGCAIITGRKGAASIYDDVPIPEECKFSVEKNQIPMIVNAIKKSLAEYESRKNLFVPYQLVVLNLENKFKKSLMDLFV